MVSLNLSNIKCKPKDDKTKCIVNDDSSLIVSLKLPSIRLTTSNSKKDDDVIFTHEEPPNPDNETKGFVYYPGNEEFQRRWCEIETLSL